MSEPRKEDYRIPPLKKLAQIYHFPTPPEHEELTWEEKERMREDQALAAMRAKARLEANTPLPWYKRIAKWYDRHYMDIFDGFGPGLMFLFTLLLFLVIFSQLAILYGW